MLTYKISTCYDGKRRKLYRKLCLICHKAVWVPKHLLKIRRYCSSFCQHADAIKRKSVYCSWCKKTVERTLSKLKSKHGYIFCSRECKEQAQSLGGLPGMQPGHYKTGMFSYRAKAFFHYGKKCRRCGYDKYEQMLDVDHKDSNRNNNKLENLEVLCVWCHALKTRKVPFHINTR